MTASLVTDASPVLAIIQAERGADEARVALAAADEVLISTVNYAEVVARLVEQQFDPQALEAVLVNLAILAVPFDEETARLSGRLRSATRSHGLSLGDRACLALGMRRGLPVLTADRAWVALGLDVEVMLIR